RTLEIFFHQQTRPEVESFAEVEQRSADKIQMSFASDVIGGGIVPAEDVVTLVARQQIHHRYPCVPLRVIVVHTETDIRNPIADLTRRNRLVAPIYRIQHGAIQAILGNASTDPEAQALRVLIVEPEPERVVGI